MRSIGSSFFVSFVLFVVNSFRFPFELNSKIPFKKEKAILFFCYFPCYKPASEPKIGVANRKFSPS
jgi:hypothetical protein